MKTKLTLLVLVLVLGYTNMICQNNDKYQQVMKQLLSQADTIKSADGFMDISSKFKRVALTENKWEAYYYAALYKTYGTFMSYDINDAVADDIYSSAEKAEEAGGDVSEIFCLKYYSHLLKFMQDPASRDKESKAMDKCIKEALSSNPQNPRPFILVGESMKNTPKQFGGGMDKAKPYFEKARDLMEGYVPKDSLAPNWGRSRIAKFFEEIEKEKE